MRHKSRLALWVRAGDVAESHKWLEGWRLEGFFGGCQKIF
jgi:hypothetical protein